MLTRRLFSLAGIAVALQAAARRCFSDVRKTRSVALMSVDIGIGPLVANDLNRRSSLKIGTAFGYSAVYYEGRFLGWLPRNELVRSGDAIELESVRLNSAGKLQIHVRV